MIASAIFHGLETRSSISVSWYGQIAGCSPLITTPVMKTIVNLPVAWHGLFRSEFGRGEAGSANFAQSGRARRTTRITG